MVEADGSEPKASVLFGERKSFRFYEEKALEADNACEVLDHRGNFYCSFYDH